MPTGQNRLAPALEAAIETLQSPTLGRFSCYVDRRVAGRPLLLLHSINAAPSALEVKPLFERYRGRRPVFAPDLPGFGLSERDNRPYSPESYAESIAVLLEAMGDGPADIIALSTTSEFAARAILATPEACNSLAVISPTGLSNRRPPGPGIQSRVKGFLNLPMIGGGLFSAVTSRASVRFFLNMSFEGAVPTEMVDYAYDSAHQPNAQFAPFSFLSGGLFTADACESLYMPLRVPGLVIYDRDPNVSFDQLPALLDSGSDWSAARIQPTRGLPHWEMLDATCEALEAFWQRADQ
ncbi:MAG: alpha/beta hydrolase [Pseudomonadota bacterium]